MIELRKNCGFGWGDCTLVHELHCNKLPCKFSPSFVYATKRAFTDPLQNLVLIHRGQLRSGKAAVNVGARISTMAEYHRR